MAEYLKRDRNAVAYLCAISMLFGVTSSSAEELVDPTRPPAGFGQAIPNAGPVAPILQSILISPTRRVAIVSGKTLRVGDKYGDAQLIAINENEIVLKNGKNRQSLYLYPSLRNQAPTTSTGDKLKIPGQQK